MEFMLPIHINPLPAPIRITDRILLTGSCFTEHIGQALAGYKFRVMQNPNGILFGPDSVCRSLEAIAAGQEVKEEELFCMQEVWHHWQFHSRFSHTDKEKALEAMNRSRHEATAFLQKADWLLITLGSSFAYKLTGEAERGGQLPGEGVANCHRAPAAWFRKELLSIGEIQAMLENSLRTVRAKNPGLRVLLTVSPVRHIRDGVVENNRSKARLLEVVHTLAAGSNDVFYFPAYELVMDVLRDYRFYDIDMVHPNYAATEFVLEKFREYCIDPGAHSLMEEIRKIRIARQHKPFQPDTEAHRRFLRAHYEKAKALQDQWGFLDMSEELEYFRKESGGW